MEALPEFVEQTVERHSFSPYFDGMDNPFEQYDSEENRKQYEKEQYQRTLERRIRKTKREVMGLKAGVDSIKDDKAKFAADMDYQRKAALLAKQNAAYKDYCERNKLRPLSDRIQIAKWDRQQAAAARGAAKRYENAHGAKISNLKNKPSDELKEINIKGIMDDYEEQIKKLTEEKKSVTLKILMGDTSAIESGKEAEKRLRDLKEKYEEFKKSHEAEIAELLKSESEQIEKQKDVFKLISKPSEVKQQLYNIGITSVEERISILNGELMVENTNQLTNLEKKFGAIKNSRVNLTVNNQTKNIAFVRTNNISPNVQELSLSGKHYKFSINEVIDRQMERSKSGFSMPALKEKCSVYSLTHEYGHLLENVMINERYFELSELKRWELQNDGLKYKSWKDKQASELWSEITKIARELSGNPLFLSHDYMSDYGKSNVYEAFAEAFANSQLGEPNIMGDAVNIWLERKGYK